VRCGGHLRNAFGYAMHGSRAMFANAGHVQQPALCVLHLGCDMPDRERHVREPAGDPLSVGVAMYADGGQRYVQRLAVPALHAEQRLQLPAR